MTQTAVAQRGGLTSQSVLSKMLRRTDHGPTAETFVRAVLGLDVSLASFFHALEQSLASTADAFADRRPPDVSPVVADPLAHPDVHPDLHADVRRLIDAEFDHAKRRLLDQLAARNPARRELSAPAAERRQGDRRGGVRLPA